MSDTTECVTPPSVLVGLGKSYAKSETRVEEIESTLKSAKAERDTIEKKLVDEMITQQVKSFKIDGVGGFRTQTVVYPNVKDREILNAWVKKSKLDWLFTIQINGQKLKSFTKELMEQSKPIPPGIEPYIATEIRRYK